MAAYLKAFCAQGPIRNLDAQIPHCFYHLKKNCLVQDAIYARESPYAPNQCLREFSLVLPLK